MTKKDVDLGQLAQNQHTCNGQFNHPEHPKVQNQWKSWSMDCGLNSSNRSSDLTETADRHLLRPPRNVSRKRPHRESSQIEVCDSQSRL